MSSFRKLFIRLFGTTNLKIRQEYVDVIVGSAGDLSSYFMDNQNSSIETETQNLLLDWMVSRPMAFWELLFVKDDERWNIPIKQIFQQANVSDGKQCAYVTQAFMLWHLSKKIQNLGNYKNCTIENIKHHIKSSLSHQNAILDYLSKFEDSLSSVLRPEDPYFDYFETIFYHIFRDMGNISMILSSLKDDPMYCLSLITFISFFFEEPNESKD